MPSIQKPIVVVGSINIDLVASAEKIPMAGETVRSSNFQVHPGGKGANQAVAIARLGYPVKLIGKVGSDAFGEQLRSYLQKAGVDITAVEVHEGSSGVAMIAVSPRGENSIVVTPGANAQVTPAFLSAHKDMIQNAGMVLAQLEVPVETVEYLADMCSKANVPLMLDPAPAHALPNPIFRHLSWFTPNETEADFFAAQLFGIAHAGEPGEIVNTLLEAGTAGVVLKMGSRGIRIASNGSSKELPAFAVKAVDTTAAGDAFNGAFATALILGMENLDAARFASAAAAISVTRSGAQPSMPTREEVEHFLEERR